MTIAIFGGSGKTGRHVVEQALEKGWGVRALVRNPEKLGIAHQNLVVVKGDIADDAAIAQTITGADVVISALGPVSNKPMMAISAGMKKIVGAMKTGGLTRIIMTAGAGVPDPLDQPRFINHVISFLLRTLAKNVILDMQAAVDFVRSSGLKWTVARGPMLTDKEPTGKMFVGYVGEDFGSQLTRPDFAAFLLAQAEGTQWIGKAPAVANTSR